MGGGGGGRQAVERMFMTFLKIAGHPVKVFSVFCFFSTLCNGKYSGGIRRLLYPDHGKLVFLTHLPTGVRPTRLCPDPRKLVFLTHLLAGVRVTHLS